MSQVAARLLLEKPYAASKSGLRSPAKQRSRRTGHLQQRSAAGTSGLATSRHSSGKSSDDSDDEGENAPLMTAKEHVQVRRVIPKAAVLAIKESRPLSASTGNINKTEGLVAVENLLSAKGSQSSLTSPLGSSTSSLDSPLDTTDNEVYKTVIPKADSSRRENSLALMLNRAINEAADAGNLTAVQAKADPPASSEMESTD